MTNQQGAPEAPRGTAADGKTELFNVPGYPLMVRAVDFNRLHAENERLAALVEAQQPATHVQNPAGIAHVAGDVSKTGAESNMAQQPALSAAAAVSDEDEALDLLATLFDAWESGTQCYEEPESSDGFLGHALRLDDEVFHRCADLLNRRRGKQPAPTAQADSQPCPTCAALARTVMLDQVSFDRKPDCYGIRQITDDEGIEEWEDIRTSPDVAREEANDMMATGRGEIYEVVPLWTTPQPSPTPPADSVTAPAGGVGDDVDAIALARYKVVPANGSMFHRFAVVAGDGKQQLYLGREVECENMARKFAGAFLDGAFYQANIAPTPPAQAADSVREDAARLDWLLLHISGAEFRRIGVHYSGNASRADVDAARKQGANHD